MVRYVEEEEEEEESVDGDEVPVLDPAPKSLRVGFAPDVPLCTLPRPRQDFDRARFQTFALPSKKVGMTVALNKKQVGSSGVAGGEELKQQYLKQQYMVTPERRYTSNRGRTFISKRPDLLSQLRAYHKPAEEEDAIFNEEVGEIQRATEQDGFSEFYTDKALFQREALKFDPRVLNVLSELWNVADSDSSGKVTKEEYIAMSM
jgi:hypothetical protein